jgi:hypothetical protein
MQVQDVVRGSVNRDIFETQVGRLIETTQQKLEGDPAKAIEVVSKSFGFTQDQNSEILRNLIEGGDLSRWGVANAVTKTANEADNYQSATDLEKAGGKIITLKDNEWNEIAKKK